MRIMKKIKTDSGWKNKLIKHIGTARNDDELAIYMELAHKDVAMVENLNQLRFDFETPQSRGLFTISSYHHGASLIFGELFRSLEIPLGRNKLLVEELVIARILHPSSKRETARWLERRLSSGFSLDQIYRVLDYIYKNRSKIQESLTNSIKAKYPAHIRYLLYDVTTMYFEKDDEDPDDSVQVGLRKRGYSKDHRNDMPQVVLGLCVNEMGMPLSFKLYSGNTYEGKTLIDSISTALSKIGADLVNVVCDAGMLSKSNLEAIEKMNQNFIISARLKSLNSQITKSIFSHDFQTNPIARFTHNGHDLVVSYSKKRERADVSRRRNSVARLEKLIDENRAIRKHKYLDLSVGKAQLNYKAIESDARFDGLKGYLTNNHTLSNEEVISHYNQLYVVEQSFRMSKSDLAIRPSFHQSRNRIEAHVILCMMALCLIRMLENKVKAHCTYPKAIEIISEANSAVIGNKSKKFLIPPLLSEEFKAIKRSIAS